MREKAIDMLVSYLKKRITTITKRAPSEVSGCIALLIQDDWEDKLDNQLDKTIQSLQLSFMRAQKPGHAHLTATLERVGASIMNYDNELPLKVKITIGALFVEALYNCGYVNLYRVPMAYKKKDGDNYVDTPHIVSINPFWVHLAPIDAILERVDLKSTVSECPENTTKMQRTIGNYSGPLIKRANKKQVLDADQPWVKAIDKMQQTPMRVNRRVLQAIIDNDNLFFKAPPKDLDELTVFNSKKLAHTYSISKASKIKDWDCFYQGIDVDYRGRFYTIEPFFSYQGQDSARGLFQFAHGKPMTDSGLVWLSVHTATSFNQTYHKSEIPEWCEEDYKTHLEGEGLEDISVDKMSFRDKVEWTNQNINEVITLGSNAEFAVDESGKLNAEAPVVFLAACIEWHHYFKSVDNGDDIFISHLPIPIDGSNNGWQHLGAMAKDELTGKLVGLIPSTIPNDFYVTTGKKLIELTKPDTTEGKILAKMPMKKVRKQLSKRGSMTRAYSAGSGAIGENMWTDVKQNGGHIEFFEFDKLKENMKTTITEELKEEAVEADKDYVKLPSNELDRRASEAATIHCKKICTNMSKTLVKAIKDVCPGPLSTMKYLQKLVAYELGEFTFYLDGIEAPAEHKALRLQRDVIFDIKDKTDEDLEKLNELTIEMDKYEYKLKEGSGNGAKYITWTTPSGFPVKYESYTENKSAVFAPIKGYQKSNGVHLVVRIKTDKPSRKDFASGTSPNVVHSYDAAHLAMTALEHTGSFIGIHDSFSTHASDVDALLDATKMNFIKMYHNRDVLQELKEDILSDDTHFNMDPPTPGNLDILDVLGSTNFFG